jgi:Protein of unknown function (DUF2934)
MKKKLKAMNPIEGIRGGALEVLGDRRVPIERIAQKAYELYEERGRQDGRALDDWLEAETIVMEESHEAHQ